MSASAASRGREAWELWLEAAAACDDEPPDDGGGGRSKGVALRGRGELLRRGRGEREFDRKSASASPWLGSTAGQGRAGSCVSALSMGAEALAVNAGRALVVHSTSRLGASSDGTEGPSSCGLLEYSGLTVAVPGMVSDERGRGIAGLSFALRCMRGDRGCTRRHCSTVGSTDGQGEALSGCGVARAAVLSIGVDALAWDADELVVNSWR